MTKLKMYLYKEVYIINDVIIAATFQNKSQTLSYKQIWIIWKILLLVHIQILHFPT
jgi:hypothetical protein